MTDQELRLECVRSMANAADYSHEVIQLAGEIYRFMSKQEQADVARASLALDALRRDVQSELRSQRQRFAGC